jgi:hypothetical protein
MCLWALIHRVHVFETFLLLLYTITGFAALVQGNRAIRESTLVRRQVLQWLAVVEMDQALCFTIQRVTYQRYSIAQMAIEISCDLLLVAVELERLCQKIMLPAAFPLAFFWSIHPRTATASLAQFRPLFSSNICISIFGELRRAIESFLNVFSKCFISTPSILSNPTLVASHDALRRPWCSHSL